MKQLTKYFNYSLTAVFSLCILLAVYGLVISRTASVPLSWLTIPSGACICCFLAKKLNSLENLPITVHRYRRISVAMCLVLFASQLIIALCADFTPMSDLSYVCTGAKNIILGRDISENLPDYQPDYFEIYPNNHMLFTVIYLLYKTEYALTGHITDTLPTAVNLIGLALSYFFMCRCAEMVHKPSRALVCAVRGMLFTPFITYTSFFYTDSMAMPLATFSAYLYLKYRKSGKIPFLALFGIFTGLAYRMKGNSLVLLVAVVIEMAVNRDKIRNFFIAVIPCFASAKIISETALKILHISHETIKEKAFPLIHWVMMSADGRGGYNRDDFLFTHALGTEKKSADFARLTEKLSQQGFSGFIAHLAEKISYTWENCTFMAGYYYNGCFSSKVFCITAFFCHFTLLFSILAGIKKCTDKTFLFRLCLFGMIIFLLIWETRCRYLVSFFPLFLLI
ncbi:MAG: glycosyltransferase family 39 protein [Ruminococcus flavefaciens]|nr:glycosyltransferase family 39 protein [Ruminococcus flavefaciens]MCM1229820.1 glycosyltransferase family 39 protein [Ruminococcus flavefaciens]